MRYNIPSLLLLLILVSCGSKSNEKSSTEIFNLSKEIKLEKLDSIQIDYLGTPTVHDIDPVSGTILFMEHKQFTEEIMVANFEGEIFGSFSKLGDVPDGYGKLMSNLRINEGTTILAYGYNGFLTYDFSGNLQGRVKLKQFEIPYFSRIAMGYGMEKSVDSYVHTNQDLQEKYSQSDIRFYEELHLMTWLKPETGDQESFIKFPESSLFRNGKHFYRGAWVPVYTIEGNKIYVVFGAEPVIYSFSLSYPFSLMSSIPFDLPDYNYFRGSDDYNSVDFSLLFISGKVLNIKKVDGHFLIAYFPGYSDADKKAENENKSPEENRIFRERMLKKYAKRIAILDSVGNRVSDFVPNGLVSESMLLRNNELWMLEKPEEDVEQDYFRIFKVGLKNEE